MDKINFTNKIWDSPENQRLKELIEEFELNPYVTSDTFQELMSLIWEDRTCYPVFFIIIPYMIEIASKLKLSKSKDIWIYLGCWISTHEKYRGGIANEVLKRFDNSLKRAEKACIEQIALAEKIDETDAQYLYASLFAFARHRLGYMTVGGYKDDLAGTSITECPQGHLIDVTVYNSGIVAYDEKEVPCKIKMANMIDIRPDKQENIWELFEKKIQQGINDKNTSQEVKSHLELAKIIIKMGVDSKLNIRYAFSLYGSLLYCNGSIDASMRAFHGLDDIVCLHCGQKFVFADGWCEDKF